MKKSMLKPALAALAIGLGLAAFADVQLANNAGTVTWDKFVEALNGGAKGEISTLPASNTAKQAYDDAEEALNDAKATLASFTEGNDGYATNTYVTAVAKAQAYLNSFTEGDEGYATNTYVVAVNEAQDSLNSFTETDPGYKNNQFAKALETAKQDTLNLGKALATAKEKNDTATLNKNLGTAQGNLEKANTNLKNFIDSLETCYNDSVAMQKTLEDSLSHVKELWSIADNQVKSIEKQIKVVQDTISTYYTKSITISSTVVDPWLAPVLKAAIALKDDYDETENATGTTEIYYKYTISTDKVTGVSTTKLWLSYFTTKPAADWSGPVKEPGFVSFLGSLSKGEEGKNNGITSITNLYVYLGSDYSAETGTTDKSAGNNVLLGSIVEQAAEAVSSVAADGRFQTTTNTQINNITPNDDRFFVAGTTTEQKTAIRTAYKGWTDKLAELQGDEADLEQQKADLTTLQGKINTHINQIIKDKTAAQTKWNQAKAGTLTGDTKFTNLTNAVTDAQTAVTTAENNLKNAEANIAAAQKAYDDAVAAVKPIQETFDTEKGKAAQALTDANTALTNAKSAADLALNDANTALTNAQKDASDKVASAQKTFDRAEATAQAAADEQALANYQEVSLTDDVITKTAITKAYAGHITGNNHVITLTEGTALFTRFTGVLSQTAINLPAGAEFASFSTGAQFSSVAIWNGTQGEVYSNKGVETAYSNFGELGYAARARFGVDFAANKLAALSDDTRVYSVTVNNSAANNAQSYVTIADGVMTTDDNAAVTIPANRFAKCADDLKTFSGTLPANLYYGSNNTCASVVITDKPNTPAGQFDFYCPVNVNAQSLTYDRVFSDGFNSACLPFAIESSETDGFTAYSYDVEDTDNGAYDGKFWFTKIDGSVAANTPMMIKPAGSDKTISMTNVTINATGTDKFVTGVSGNGGISFGMLTKTGVGELLGESQLDHIYGLKGTEFQPAGKNASFGAFRMAIRSAYSAPATGNAPRKIGIRDQFGNDITDEELSGIKGVEAEATSLAVTTAQGQIIFTSEADYGTVQVYGIDGRVAANATVMAGTTAIDVPAGMYIVLGKKVLVK